MLALKFVSSTVVTSTVVNKILIKKQRSVWNTRI